MESLFDLIIKSSPPNKFVKAVGEQTKLKEEEQYIFLEDYKEQWNGFLFFDLVEGYQLRCSEIISIPLSHIFDPLNWVTLSHEVSHAYYQRISFLRLESELMEKIQSNINNDRDITPFMIEIKYFSWELFAQWFDYKHFFEGDFKFYLWSVWRTWFDVQRVSENVVEYWVRSVFVKVCHSWKEIDAKINEAEKKYLGNKKTIIVEIQKILYDEFKKVEKIFKEFFPDEYPKFGLKSTNDEKLMLRILTYTFHFAHYFESDYVNTELLNSTKMNDASIPKHIKDILYGHIIFEPISNPFSLVKELLRTFYLKREKPYLKTKSILALIYSLWNTSYKYSR